MTQLPTTSAPSGGSLAIAALLAVALLAAAVLSATTEGRKETTMSTSTAVQERVIPAIDASAPSNTRTATFALG